VLQNHDKASLTCKRFKNYLVQNEILNLHIKWKWKYHTSSIFRGIEQLSSSIACRGMLVQSSTKKWRKQ